MLFHLTDVAEEAGEYAKKKKNRFLIQICRDSFI